MGGEKHRMKSEKDGRGRPDGLTFIVEGAIVDGLGESRELGAEAECGGVRDCRGGREEAALATLTVDGFPSCEVAAVRSFSA